MYLFWVRSAAGNDFQHSVQRHPLKHGRRSCRHVSISGEGAWAAFLRGFGVFGCQWWRRPCAAGASLGPPPHSRCLWSWLCSHLLPSICLWALWGLWVRSDSVYSHWCACSDGAGKWMCINFCFLLFRIAAVGEHRNAPCGVKPLLKANIKYKCLNVD